MTAPLFTAGNINRRDLLSAALATAAAAAWSADAQPLAAAEAAKFTLLAAEKAETQKFPWGSIRWLMNSEIDPQAETTLGIIQIDAQQSNPLHIHPNSAEYLYVLSGTCQQRLGDRWVTLKPGDTLRVPRGMPHMARTKDEPFRAVSIYDTGKRQMVPVSDDSAARPQTPQ